MLSPHAMKCVTCLIIIIIIIAERLFLVLLVAHDLRELNNREAEDVGLVGVGVGTSTNDHDSLAVVLEGSNRAAVSSGLGDLPSLPMTLSTEHLVSEESWVTESAGDESTVGTTVGSPVDVGSRNRLDTIDLNDHILGLVEAERVLVNTVGDGEGVVLGLEETAVLIHVDPVTSGELSNGRHSRAVSVSVLNNVILGIGPVLEINGGLVRELLAESIVLALISVVNDYSVVVEENMRLPDRGLAVVGKSNTTSGNVRSELPVLTTIDRGIHVNAGLA